MSEALESELDALFQLPPAEMVAARNELVARLKKAGERDAAARVKGLKRPAPAAWAINQIFFRERALLEAALADVARVRELQATDGVDRQQLTAAVSAQRATLQAVVDAALRCCTAAGLPTGGAQERRIFATVQGWLSGSGAEVPGRMTEELEPSGFGGVGQLGIPSPLPAAGSSRPLPLPSVATAKQPLQLVAAPVVPSVEELAARAREQAEARVRERKQAAAWALERLGEKREKLSAAEQAVERAKREVEDAERALADRRSRLQERESEQARRHADVVDAERAHADAAQALAASRADLAKL